MGSGRGCQAAVVGKYRLMVVPAVSRCEKKADGACLGRVVSLAAQGCENGVLREQLLCGWLNEANRRIDE